MQHFQIRSFSGASTRVESTNQDRGTLRRIEVAVIAPNGGISSPVTWQSLWGDDSIDDILGVLIDQTPGNGYFYTIDDGANKLLLFYEVG